MRFNTPEFLLLAGLSAVLSAPGALAGDAPLRKSGLWEIRTETSAGGQKLPGPMTMQMCIDQSQDCLLYTSPSPRDKRQSRMPSSA